MRDPLSRVEIKYKLTGAFVGICLLAFGVGGYLISVSAGSALEREISLRLASEGAGFAQMLSSRLHLLGRRAEDFASDGFIRTRMEAILAARLSKRGPEEGTDVYIQLAKHLASNKFPLVQPMADLALCSMDGEVLTSVNGLTTRPPASLIRELVAKDSLWCSSFCIDTNGGQTFFAVATPLWDLARERRLGSMFFWIDAQVWTDAMLRDARNSSGVLVGTHSVIISDQRGRQLPLFATSDEPFRETERRNSPHIAAAGGSGTSDAGRHGLMRDLITQDHEIDEHGWHVHVAVDAQRAMLPVSGLQSSFLGAGLIIALVALVLLYFPVRFLVQPLAAMSDAARAMTAGDFSRRVDEQAEDEIGHLARSFNLMAEATQERTARLENNARLLEQQGRELGIERDLLNTVVHSMDDAVMYFNREGQLIVHNAAAESLHRHLREESFPLSPRRCGCDRAGERDCRNCLLDHRMPARDCVLDIGDRVFEVVSTSIASQSGLEGTVLVGRDITHRLRIDEKQAHQDRLAVLGEVSAVMAHELNNPLAAISMFAQMMRTELRDDAEHSEHLEVILRNTDNCKRTIRYLLSYSRGEASGEEECDVHELLLDVVRFLRPLYDKANVCFDLELNAADPVLSSDETYLRQVFVNLMMNALQAMNDDGGRIVIRSGADEHNAAGFTVDIIDNGPGIAAEHATRIFEPFFTSKPTGQGTGLGLSISRRIAETLGGSLVLASSRPGETIFRVSLPRSRSELQQILPASLEVKA